LPDLDVVNVLTQLAARVKRLRQTLIDPQRSSYRLVLTPDRAVVKEARRAETYLNLFEYPIDALLVNRVLPDQEPGNAYLDELVAHQRRVMEEIRHSFVTLPLFEAPLLTEEPAGMTGLRDLAVRVFGEQDPTRVMHVGPTQRIEPSGRGYVLRIPMPNVEVDRLDLTKRGDELYVDVGNFRREVTLPLALAGLEPGTAHVRGGVLEIPFEPVEADATVAS
jgi:arsenite/tail-anchored protein-transporting ATPase